MKNFFNILIAAPLLVVPLLFILTSCNSKQDTAAEKSHEFSFSGNWQVEDIDQGGVIDSSMVTMQFNEPNRIAGSTGCNRYTGTVSIDKNIFTTSRVSTTKKACVAAISKQEQRFLDALNAAKRYEVKSDTWFVIYDDNNQPRLKLIKMTDQQQ